MQVAGLMLTSMCYFLSTIEAMSDSIFLRR
jgi:hypothetical protein